MQFLLVHSILFFDKFNLEWQIMCLFGDAADIFSS